MSTAPSKPMVTHWTPDNQFKAASWSVSTLTLKIKPNDKSLNGY